MGALDDKALYCIRAPEEVSCPQVEAHGGHTGPDDSLVGQVQAVEVLGEDLHLQQGYSETALQWDSEHLVEPGP